MRIGAGNAAINAGVTRRNVPCDDITVTRVRYTVAIDIFPHHLIILAAPTRACGGDRFLWDEDRYLCRVLACPRGQTGAEDCKVGNHLKLCIAFKFVEALLDGL